VPRAKRISTATSLAAIALLFAGLLPAHGHAATARACRPVDNPYPSTRYDDVDLTRIRARGVSCRTARRVARAAHRKALGVTPTLSGIRRFTWGRWKVTGDLRPAHDRYLATAPGGKRVRWRF
jgi:hypothetical protein